MTPLITCLTSYDTGDLTGRSVAVRIICQGVTDWGWMLRNRLYLVTGGLGYIGSVVTNELVSRGSRVVVLDNELAARAPDATARVKYVHGDAREAGRLTGLFQGVDGVVHLAAIVGDAACKLDLDLTTETNFGGTVAIAEACVRAGVPRMVFASTCSAYGHSGGQTARVDASLKPLSLYAQTKINAENYLLAARTDAFAPCVLRLATIHGLSPRMRFDLAINGMTAQAVAGGEINVFGGQQWRPFLHVRDAARSIVAALVKKAADQAEIYNCGSEQENYTLYDVGLAVADEVPGTMVSVKSEIVDPRDYRVSFDSTADELGFQPSITLRDGIREVRDALLAGDYADFTAARYHNHLLTSQFIMSLANGNAG